MMKKVINYTIMTLLIFVLGFGVNAYAENKTKKTTMFRELLAKEKGIVAPSVYDCLTAKIAEKAGFKAIFLSGFCLNIAYKGVPDLGMETRTDLVDNARRIAASVDIPLFVDGGSGYGGPIGTRKTIQELEAVGAAGCFIEDQYFPRTSPGLGRTPLIPMEEFVAKLKSALDARQDKDFVIMARTDPETTEEAIQRLKAYREAGADLVLPLGRVPHDKETLGKIYKAVGSRMMLAPFDSPLTIKDYEEVGVQLLVGIEVMDAAVKAFQDLFKVLKTSEKGSVQIKLEQPINVVLDWQKWFDVGMKYGRKKN